MQNGERSTKIGSDKFRKTVLCRLCQFPLRFQQKVRIDAKTGCWMWTGATHYPPRFPEYKYGVYSVDGTPYTNTSAHRFAYEFVHGPLLPALKLDIDHGCQTKLCVNPSHVGPLTHQDNCRLRRKRGRVAGSVRWQRERRSKGL